MELGAPNQRYMDGLEVQADGGGLETRHNAIEPDIQFLPKEGRVPNGSQFPVGSPERRIFGRPLATILLLLLSIVFAILTITFGALYGDEVQKNKALVVNGNGALDCSGSSGDKPPTPSAAASSTISSLLTSQTLSAPTTSSTSGFPPPSSDCSSLGSNFITGAPKASGNTLQNFTISCDTDRPSNNMLGVYVYSFEACMQACTTYNWRSFDTGRTNLSCAGVTYTPLATPVENGNCLLKYDANTPSQPVKDTETGWVIS